VPNGHSAAAPVGLQIGLPKVINPIEDHFETHTHHELS
jgi:hypothetical protein